MSEQAFYNLSKKGKLQVFKEVSEEKNLPMFAIEKDWWVVQTLDVIFQLDIAEHILFKGGTSLSKA